MGDGKYRPTDGFDTQLAAKLDIPVSYIRRLRTERPDLYDLNVNGWLQGKTMVRGGEREVIHPADARSFLFRGFRDDSGGTGIARAFLSDRFGFFDDLDILMAALEGVRSSGIDAAPTTCDLSEKRMLVTPSSVSMGSVPATVMIPSRERIAVAEATTSIFRTWLSCSSLARSARLALRVVVVM